MRIIMKNFISNKERKKLIYKINNTRLNNEDDIFDLAITLCRWSVRLRSEILKRQEEEEV